MPTNASPSWRAAPPRAGSCGRPNARHSTESRPVWAAKDMMGGTKEGADGRSTRLKHNAPKWARSVPQAGQADRGGATRPIALIAPIALQRHPTRLGRRSPSPEP